MSWMGRWIQHLVLARVPVIVLLILAALALPGDDGPPTLVNMRIMESPFDLGLTVFLAILASLVSGHHVVQIWNLAPVRFGTRPPRVSAFLGGRNALRRLPFALFALPLVGRLWAKNAFDPIDSGLGLWRSTAAVVAAVAVMAGLLLGVEKLRQLLAGWLDRLKPFVLIARWLGDGYWDRSRNRVEPGHALAVTWAVLMALLYAAGYFVLHPLRSGHDLVPTLVYALVLIMLLESVLSGAAFFLDKFRAPLLLCLLIYAGVMNQLFPKDHYFQLRPSPAEPPSLEVAVRQRLDLQRRFLSEDQEPVLTVVAASGGGIQAAAWTAQVLAGLQQEIGEDFTRSIHLISSVSGGSVGSFFFLRGADPALGAPRSATLEPIRRAATSSSLEATAWGLSYPDFLRGFLPFIIERRYDRAWAMELSWLEAADRMLDGDGREASGGGSGLWLSDWMRAAAEGWLPGVIFNSTIVEDGHQLLISNLDLPELKEYQPVPGGQTLARRYPGHGTVDLPLVTGARLSATFPYVTPQARAMSWRDEEAELPGWHLADGGYFDNSGLVAALEWLLELGTPAAEPFEPWGEALKPFAKILLVQINAFPPKCSAEDLSRDAGSTGRTRSEDAKGWFYSALGPLSTIIRVRTTIQTSRNDL
ncbi:MAG: patatin-like phospholipase family protein, partial [Thermoanaerobaculia bacterium]